MPDRVADLQEAAANLALKELATRQALLDVALASPGRQRFRWFSIAVSVLIAASAMFLFLSIYEAGRGSVAGEPQLVSASFVLIFWLGIALARLERRLDAVAKLLALMVKARPGQALMPLGAEQDLILGASERIRFRCPCPDKRRARAADGRAPSVREVPFRVSAR